MQGARSKVDGEAQPKHLAVLELKGQQFRLQTYRLKSVRPFATGEAQLDDDELGLDPEDVHVRCWEMARAPIASARCDSGPVVFSWGFDGILHSIQGGLRYDKGGGRSTI